ncbi:hypothetical protein NKG94_15225 [Micromonospora sp. M12]
MDSQAPPVCHMPQNAPSTTAVARHASVLWWVTQPPALYCTWAVRAPATDRSRTMSKTGPWHSARFVVLAGQ